MEIVELVVEVHMPGYPLHQKSHCEMNSYGAAVIWNNRESIQKATCAVLK
jgi:hypothetical protein